MSRPSPTLRLALRDLAKLAGTDPEAFCEALYSLREDLDAIGDSGVLQGHGPYRRAASGAARGISDAALQYAIVADEIAADLAEPELPLGLAA